MNEDRESDPRLDIIGRLHRKAEVYRSISGAVSLVAGTLSLTASAFLLWVLQSSGSRAINPAFFFGVWIFVVALATGTAIALLRVKSRRTPPDAPFFSDSARFAVETVFPYAVTAIALGFLLSWRGAAFSLSILWITLYGLALCATRPFAPASLVSLGKAFLITGISLMLFVYLRIRFLIGYDRSDSQTLMIMGLTFGLYHLIYAIDTWMKSKRSSP